MAFVSEKSDDFVPQLRALIHNLKIVETVSGPVDCSGLEWVSPLTVLPLAAYLYQKRRRVMGMSGYLQTICFPNGVDRLQNFQTGQTYFPIVRFPNNSIPLLEQLTHNFSQLVLQGVGQASKMIRNAWFYAVSELVTNVAEHSRSPLGWIHAQYWPAKGFLDAVVLDQGRGFKKTYEDAQKVSYTHQEAIRRALEGHSVKDDVERGRGLRTTRSLVTKSPLNGKFLIISGNCGYYADAKKQTWLNLGAWQWNGAIIAFRIHRGDKPVDIYPYVE